VKASVFFLQIRTKLKAKNDNMYEADELLQAYNQAQGLIYGLLREIGAPIAMKSSTITGDGTHYFYDLPTDFLAPVPSAFKPRSPVDAAANYTHGQEVILRDRLDPAFTHAPTSVGVAYAALLKIEDDGTPRVYFPAIITAGAIYDFMYYPIMPVLADGTEGATDVPWRGRLDDLMARTVESILKEELEFSTDKREVWMQREEQNVRQVLGMTKLQEQHVTMSFFQGMPS
jgi:hypothetical protein